MASTNAQTWKTKQSKLPSFVKKLEPSMSSTYNRIDEVLVPLRNAVKEL